MLKKRTHRDIVQMGAAIIEQTGVQSASQVPAEFLLGAAVKDVLLVSVTRVRNDHYPEGHFVTLMGVDGPPTSSRRYLVLNSGVKIKDKWRNTCSEDVPDEPGQYTGQLSWISSEDIQFKSWENGAYMTWRLE
ncbi:hypothetical protein LJR125_000440 [Pseudoxanthomonas sp. LjRoot125]|uniref:hypothetical protein n=1 Tax=Pseudoxanthomonas sp. LjRoot125 TaxID=3342258 RepID=UPI003E11FACB